MKATDEAHDRAKAIEGEMMELSDSLKIVNTEIEKLKKCKANMIAELDKWLANEKEQTPKAMEALQKDKEIILATWDKWITQSFDYGKAMAERYAELINTLDDLYDHHGL